MKLYNYFRSSASYRVRIALNLKGLSYEYIPIHLRRGGGEHLTPSYKAIHPQALIPTLEDNGRMLTQSLAILEYLEERYPSPPLLPRDHADRALVRSIALAVACEMHPLQNLRVLNYLQTTLHHTEAEAQAWGRHWITEGLVALEQMVKTIPNRNGFCFGSTPTFADLCLVPQMVNARRFGCDLTACPTLVQIDSFCQTQPAFAKAAPETQPDAES
ncbi:MAG: maleylacetoacetate isomerase [Deltaproteobacteria bacterium]|nr:maleylacetoacetate isomerase [Deltaproteobacteria bacterium]